MKFTQPFLKLMTVLNRNKVKDTINRLVYNCKTPSALGEKKFIPLYAEDLNFLIKPAGWLVTYIYEYFTFEQGKLKEILSLEIRKLR